MRGIVHADLGDLFYDWFEVLDATKHEWVDAHCALSSLPVSFCIMASLPKVHVQVPSILSPKASGTIRGGLQAW